MAPSLDSLQSQINILKAKTALSTPTQVFDTLVWDTGPGSSDKDGFLAYETDPNDPTVSTLITEDPA